MKISKGTIVRTILVLIALINIGLERAGIDVINVDGNTVLKIVEYAIEVAILIVGCWKNNSFSAAAIKADKFLQQLKNSGCCIEEDDDV